MEFKEYFNLIIEECEGFSFATEAYIKLLYDEQVSIQDAKSAIKSTKPLKRLHSTQRK